jgi:hypothetical protein
VVEQCRHHDSYRHAGKPYQTPSAPLTEAAAPSGLPPGRFRFRVVPATLCFLHGGSLAIAFVIQIGLPAWVAAQVGSSRLDFEALSFIVTGPGAFSALILFAGWLFLRGRWLEAVALVAWAFGVGFAVDRSIGRGNSGDRPAMAILRRIVKPN